jgi:alkanesulfonate monooxygenase SsuD/methylene tetrahydromethanopterin reductase-like flavin-dependent oxidoreductase (luciferase family)
MVSAWPQRPTGRQHWSSGSGRSQASAGSAAESPYQTDVAREGETVLVVASPEDVYAAVREWLEGFLESGFHEREI